MVATATSTNILDEIRAGPHWKVVIHPQEFVAERIATLAECVDAIRESQVRLRGWPYPHLDYENMERGGDWIASCVTFEEQREYWRFYQSGLFVHYFGFREDRPSWRNEIEERYRMWGLAADGFSPNAFLDVDNALHTFTEIFEFTVRLMATGALGARHEAPVVRIGMYQIKDRTLSAALPRVVDPRHHATTEPLEHSWRVGGLGTRDEAAKQAREATRWFLERFGMRLRDLDLKNEQEKFFQKRWWR